MTCSGFGQANTDGQPSLLDDFQKAEKCAKEYREGIRGLVVKTTNME
jgi:hypothetical protein